MQRFRLSWMLWPVGVWCVWAVIMYFDDRWGAVAACWPLSVTMLFGSFIAGATSEGGGAVAFPVMTLLLDISPSTARDFSLAIQSVGMTAASALIITRKIPVSWKAIRWSSFGGAIGVILGLEFIAPYLPAAYTKIFFTSLWLSFGVCLFALNTHRVRCVHETIGVLNHRYRMVLILIGIAGGLISSITGTGLDLLVFTALALYFRISEKIATPTSVVLMAGNSVVGTIHRAINYADVDGVVWDYWLACVPIVVIGAPLGAYFISTRSRRLINYLLYTSITVQYLFSIYIVPQSWRLVSFSGATILCGLMLFTMMIRLSPRRAKLSKRLLDSPG